LNKILSVINKNITKLIALWALSESGLGGLMFALHIPLTGIFVGGFAIVLIALIAFYSGNDFRQIIKATIIVLVIKATVSPHAPLPAYLAVAFQGCLGALLFAVIRNFRLATYLLAVIGMAESALQKIVIMTLIYGNSIWEALDAMLKGLFKEFSIPTTIHFSYWIIGIYLLVYIIWGFIIGRFASHLPNGLQEDAEQVVQDYQLNYANTISFKTMPEKRRKGGSFVSFFGVLLFILIVFWYKDWYASSRLLSIALRSIAAVFLLYFVVRPIMDWLIKRWLQSRNHAIKQEALEVMEWMPSIRKYVNPSWKMAQAAKGKWRQMRYFVRFLIILTLYA
jgi:hypothetical protein